MSSNKHQKSIRNRLKFQQRLNGEGPFEFRNRNMYRTPNAAAANRIFSSNKTLSNLGRFHSKRQGSKHKGSKINSGGFTLKNLIGGFNKLFR